MSNIQIFKNEDFGEIRTLEVESKAFLSLQDTCRVLDIKNPRDTKSRLNQDGVVTTDGVDSMGRKIPITFIDESNFYKLIFQSRKPEAEKFTDWVTSKVLPSIRKNGGYIADQENLSDNELMAKALLVAQNTINNKNKELEEAHKKIESDAGKVLFAECVESSKTSVLIGELAKILKQNGIDIGQNRLFEWLRKNKYLSSRPGNDFNNPTQKSMNMGLFEIKKTVVVHSNGYKTISTTSKVTGKGQIYFINKFKELLNKP